MKKILSVVLLCVVAFVGSSCQDNNNDKQLVKSLEGTWQGSIYLDDEIPADIQFFGSEDGTTGKFVEIAYLHEIDGDFDIRYFSYACGDYSVKDGQLTLTLIPESTYAEPFDEGELDEYVAALWEFYQEEGRTLLWEDEEELKIAVLETLEDSWSEVCEERNASGNTFKNLTVTADKMSFVVGDKTWEFKRVDHDWFTGYPYTGE